MAPISATQLSLNSDYCGRMVLPVIQSSVYDIVNVRYVKVMSNA